MRAGEKQIEGNRQEDAGKDWKPDKEKGIKKRPKGTVEEFKKRRQQRWIDKEGGREEAGGRKS